MCAEFFLEGRKLRCRGQRAVEQQMNDFLETRIRGEIVDVVSAIGQAAFFALDITKQRAPDDDAFEPAIDDDSSGRQCRVPPARSLTRDPLEPFGPSRASGYRGASATCEPYCLGSKYQAGSDCGKVMS